MLIRRSNEGAVSQCQGVWLQPLARDKSGFSLMEMLRVDLAVLVETKCELKASPKWEVVSTEIHGSNGVAVVVPRRGTVKEMERIQSFVIVEARVNRRKMFIIGIYVPCGAAERRVVVAQVDEALIGNCCCW